MASYGLLMGIGQGLQQVGGMLQENNKTQLLEKLKQDSEQRAEARKIASEQREQVRLATTPDPSQTDYVQENGEWFERIRSGTGDVLEKRKAPENKSQELRLGQQKDTLTIDKLLQETQLGAKKLAAFDANQSLERRLTESQIQRNKDTGLAATMRADRTEDKSEKELPSVGQVSANMIEVNQDIIDQLEIDPSVARMIADRLAPQLIERAKAGNVMDQNAIFLDALRRIKKGEGVSGSRTPSFGKETLNGKSQN